MHLDSYNYGNYIINFMGEIFIKSDEFDQHLRKYTLLFSAVFFCCKQEYSNRIDASMSNIPVNHFCVLSISLVYLSIKTIPFFLSLNQKRKVLLVIYFLSSPAAELQM